MFGKKKDSKKESTKAEEKAVVSEEKATDKAEEKDVLVEETKSNETPDDDNDGEGVSTQTVAKAKKSEDGEVTFRRPGHQKMYDRLDPKSKYAQNLVRRHANK